MRKSWVRALCAVVLTVTGTAITFEKGDAAEDPLLIGVHVWPGFLPAHLIRDKGILEEVGANAQVRDFRRVVDSLTSFTAGQTQGNSMMTADALIPISKGIGMKVIWLSDESAGADGIVATHEIKSIADFKGKEIAYEFGGVSQLLLITALKTVELTLDDVKSTNMSSYDAGTAFIGGQVDIAVTWEPFLTQGEESGRGRVIFHSGDTPGLITDLFAFRQEAIDNRPQDVLGSVEAWKKALEYIETNPEDAYQIMADAAGITSEELVEQLDGIKPYTDLKEVCEILRDRNSIFYKNAQIQAEFLFDNDFIEVMPDVNNIADARFVCTVAGEYDREELLSQ
ncbi:MAG: ABC transporter substrate-binding protein [Gammaproteobacteria bacterium]|nr:ABC transporter substrate-binding protein [Gammaproteobacteria bacterium]MDH3468955.1 ABC transporter substrate-binding protein [Gammaproteobacteria bacterium]